MKKNDLFIYSIPLIIFIVTAVLLYYGLDRDPRAIPSPLINKPLPASIFMDHKKMFLGKISLLNVWATWCASCKEEHSVLMDIAQKKQVMIYGLNYKDEPKLALRWLLKKGNPYAQLLFDEQGRMGVDLGVYGTPETYVIDSQGIIRYKYIGPITKEVWDGVILPEINRLPASSHRRPAPGLDPGSSAGSSSLPRSSG